jgi:MOSC domain-containing protein YiiM
MGTILSVGRSLAHAFSKPCLAEITVLAGLGIEGDAHAGQKVKHRYLVKKNPNSPNLAQVHLLQSELFKELESCGLDIQPGQMGENITTSGVDLLSLPLGTRLLLGVTAVVQVTGLRTPCTQMDHFRPGLKKACLGRDQQGGVLRKSGIMAIAIEGGVVRPGDQIVVELPKAPWIKLGPV